VPPCHHILLRTINHVLPLVSYNTHQVKRWFWHQLFFRCGGLPVRLGNVHSVSLLFSVLVAVVAIGRSGTILLNADKSVVILDKFVVGHSSSRFQLVFKVICFWKVAYYSNSSHQYSYLSNFKKYLVALLIEWNFWEWFSNGSIHNFLVMISFHYFLVFYWKSSVRWPCVIVFPAVTLRPWTKL